MTNTLRQKLNNAVRKYGNKIHQGLGDVLTYEVSPKQILAGGLVLGQLGTPMLVAADEPIVVGAQPAPQKITLSLEEEFYHNGDMDTFTHWASVGQQRGASAIFYITDTHPIEGLDSTLTRVSSRIPLARPGFSGSFDLLGQRNSLDGSYAMGVDARGTAGPVTLGGAIEEAVLEDGTENFVNQAYGLARFGPVELSAGFSNRSDIPTRTSGIGGVGVYMPLNLFLGGAVEEDGEDNFSASYVLGRYVNKPGEGFGFRLRGVNDNHGNNTAEAVVAMDSLMGQAGIAAPVRQDNGMALDHKVLENWYDAHPRMWDRGAGPVVVRAIETWNQTMSSGYADVMGQIPIGDHFVARVGANYADKTEQGIPERTQIPGAYLGFGVNNVAGFNIYGFAGAAENLSNGQRDFRSILGVSGAF